MVFIIQAANVNADVFTPYSVVDPCSPLSSCGSNARSYVLVPLLFVTFL